MYPLNPATNLNFFKEKEICWFALKISRISPDRIPVRKNTRFLNKQDYKYTDILRKVISVDLKISLLLNLLTPSIVSAGFSGVRKCAENLDIFFVGDNPRAVF